MTETSQIIQALYYAMGLMAMLVTGGFAYISLFVKWKMAELRLKIIEDVRQEFAPIERLKSLEERTDRLVNTHTMCPTYTSIQSHK